MPANSRLDKPNKLPERLELFLADSVRIAAGRFVAVPKGAQLNDGRKYDGQATRGQGADQRDEQVQTGHRGGGYNCVDVKCKVNQW